MLIKSLSKGGVRPSVHPVAPMHDNVSVAELHQVRAVPGPPGVPGLPGMPGPKGKKQPESKTENGQQKI